MAGPHFSSGGENTHRRGGCRPGTRLNKTHGLIYMHGEDGRGSSYGSGGNWKLAVRMVGLRRHAITWGRRCTTTDPTEITIYQTCISPGAHPGFGAVVPRNYKRDGWGNHAIRREAPPFEKYRPY
jgi:hypothetical protein